MLLYVAPVITGLAAIITFILILCGTVGAFFGWEWSVPCPCVLFMAL